MLSSIEVKLVVVQVTCDHISWFAVYIPPTVQTIILTRRLLLLIPYLWMKTVIVGDFIAPDVNWNSLSGVSIHSKSLCEIVFLNNLIQLVEEPTNHSGNILNLVLINCPAHFHKVCIEHIPPRLCLIHSLIRVEISSAITKGVCGQGSSLMTDIEISLK